MWQPHVDDKLPFLKSIKGRALSSVNTPDYGDWLKTLRSVSFTVD